MLLITFLLLSTPYALPDEYLLVQASAVTKNLIFGLEKKPDSSRFLFVNVSKDKALLDIEDPDVPGYVVGNEAITDRSKLVKFLELIIQKPEHKFMVLDIDFKGKTEHDSALAVLINKIPRLHVSYHRDEKDKPDYPEMPIKKKLTLSDIEVVWKQRFKFKIFFNDSIKSTPLVMYETVHKKKFKKGYSPLGIHYIDKQPIFNNFILDYRIRRMDYGTRYPKIYLGESLRSSVDSTGEISLEAADVLMTQVKNRIVFVGDFEDRDIHDTIYGEIPGPIILINAFLALEYGDNKIYISLILFLLIVYTTISYLVLSRKYAWKYYFTKKIKRWKEENPKIEMYGGVAVYIILFSSISIISFFIYDLHVGGLALAFYIFVFDYIKTWINKIIEKRSIKTFVKDEYMGKSEL
ncbi:MAG: hypothetical protein EAZ85_06040 [Bacteroidetes bacterium]|nr:MAG: hypothetical protein EAZ85_06040 [Bacteroidota bacterium]TAG89803.1 MAG: hypothetical protein EAZ20_05675 [Bacteroidota bacterium]